MQNQSRNNNCFYDSNADTSALERQIDKMVYKLYGLAPEEIAIVESES